VKSQEVAAGFDARAVVAAKSYLSEMIAEALVPVAVGMLIRADALERLLALEPNADLLKRWQGLKAEPLRKLEIEHDGHGGGYQAWFTDADGNLHEFGDPFDHPYAAVDWCERNGFAWEVIGATGDPLVALAAWRAEQCR
jgi:hypothetical protein